MATGSSLSSFGAAPKGGCGRPGAAPYRLRVDVAETPRTGLPLRSRLAAASPWPRKRIVGEVILTLALSGIAGLLHTTETGSVARGGALALVVAVLSLARRALPATVLVVSSALAGQSSARSGC